MIRVGAGFSQENIDDSKVVPLSLLTHVLYWAALRFTRSYPTLVF